MKANSLRILTAALIIGAAATVAWQAWAGGELVNFPQMRSAP
jgi:hypothetical protein